MSEAAGHHHPLVQTLLPGAVGGVCNTLTGHPLDLVKVRWQVVLHQHPQQLAATAAVAHNHSNHKSSGAVGLRSTLSRIVASRGIRGLYQGVSAPLLAVVPAFAVSFGSYDYVQRQMLERNTSQQQQQLTLTQLATAGGISGIALAVVLGPMERIKCLLQVGTAAAAPGRMTTTTTSSLGGMVQHCYRTGGVRSLFRGTWLTMGRDVPGNAAYFGTYEAIHRTMSSSCLPFENNDSNYYYTTAVTVVAGGFAGVANWIIAIPMDVIKSRWQTLEHYTSVRGMVVELVQQQGWQALFRGLTPALARAFPANAACFLGVEATRRLLPIND